LAARAATAEYRDSEDVIRQFLSECCLEGPPYKARGNDLYQAYKKWAEAGKEWVKTQTKFGMLISERFQKFQSNGIWYLGIGLKNDMESNQEN